MVAGLPKLPLPEPADYTIEDIRALKALQAGNANEGQQQRALAWILNHACRMGVDPFKPENPRLTEYLVGRQSVGRQILELVNAKAKHG